MKLAINNRKLLDFAYVFRDRIAKEHWVPRYDRETDEFSLTVPKLSKDARVKYFDKELAFYVTTDEQIEGLFIEYFRNNFIQHHDGFKETRKDMEAQQSHDDELDEDSIVELNKESVKEIIPELEEILKFSLAEKVQTPELG